MGCLALNTESKFISSIWRPPVIFKKTSANVLNVSGGKDSLAVALIGRELEVPNQTLAFADTGHEHEKTYEYIDYLETKLGKIKRVKADFTDRINAKREYVVEHWPKKLTTEKSGRWKALRKTKQQEPDPIECEKRFEIGVQQGDYVWLSARRPLTDEQAQEVVETALSVLRPTGNPFLDLCIWKGRFPSTKARFCTTELKHEPIRQQIVDPLREKFTDIVSWQGVRAQESKARQSIAGYEVSYEEDGEIHIYRPIHTWLHESVFEIAKYHGIKPNPLYKEGCGRVGCMPCVNTNKKELSEIFKRWPDVIERLKQWELIVAKANKYGNPTFFCSSTDPMNEVLDGQLVSAETHGIEAIRDWAMTGRGGRQFDMFIQSEPLTQCSSIYAGVCE